MNRSFIITQENFDSEEALAYRGWGWLLGKTVTLLPEAEIDVNGNSFPIVKTLFGKAMAVAVYKQGADVAVEFPFDIPGGHTCCGTTPPRRGLWFGHKHVEVRGEYEKVEIEGPVG